jgi:hypothetical protein
MEFGISPAQTKRALGRLETSQGGLVCTGGVQLNEDGSGFFIAQPGAEMRSVRRGKGVVRTVAGEVFSVVNLRVAPATMGLPRHYTFVQIVEADVSAEIGTFPECRAA